MASRSPLFDTTMHLRSRWIRADYGAGAFAVGAVSAYVVGRSSFAGRPISSPHAAAEIGFSGLVAPQSVTLDREQVWLLADRLERKPDGDYRRNAGRMPRIASHIDGALPWGLGEEAARRIVEGFSRWIVETYGVAVEFAAHHKEKPFDHAHFVVGTRSLEERSFGKKVRAFNGVAQHHADRKAGQAITHERQDGTVKHVSSAMDQIRAKWADLISAEIGCSIDHRSYERRGLAIEPVPRVRRGEIEFQKRQESHTGVGPAWRKDRRRRIAERSQLRPDVGDGPAAKHEVTRDGYMSLPIETSSHEKERLQHKASKRTREGEIADRWIELLRAHVDPRPSTMSRAESDERGRRFEDAEDAYAKSVLGSTQEATATSWAAKADLIRVAHRQRRDALAGEQIKHDLALRYRQRSALLLITRLKESNAALALNRLVEAARAFIEQGKRLVEAHDQQWLQLFASQKAAWRDALHDHARAIGAQSVSSTQTPNVGLIILEPPKRSDVGDSLVSTRHVARDARMPPLIAPSSHGIQHCQHKVSKRTREGEIVDRWIEQLRMHVDRRPSTLYMAASNDRARRFDDAEDAYAEHMLGSMRKATVTSWAIKAALVRVAHRQQRDTLTREQNDQDLALRHRHRGALMLIARLKVSNASLALNRLVEAARTFVEQGKRLMEAHDQQWLQLYASQKAAWRHALHEHASVVDAKQLPSTQTPMRAPTAAATAASTTRNHRRSEPLEQQVATSWLRQLRSQLGEPRSSQRGQWREHAIEADNLRIAQVHRDIRADVRGAVKRSDTAAEPNDARFDSMVERVCSRWDERLREVLARQRLAREEMLAAQEGEDRRFRARQHTILDLVERVIAADALHGMLRLIQAAKHLASETRILLENQGQDWLALLDAQRQQWPKPKRLSEKSKATPELAGTGHGIVEGGAATARVAPTTVPPMEVTAAPLEDEFAKPTPPVVRRPEQTWIVEELADWLLLRNHRSQQKNSAMAAFLGERVEVFDARTNARRNAFVEGTQTLGYSTSGPQAPRSPKEIFHDPIVQGDAELLALVRAIAVRPAKTTAVHPLQRPVGPASMPKREGRKNEA